VGPAPASTVSSGAVAPELTAVANLLHSAAIRMLRAVRPADAATGLSAARLSALSVVVHAGPLSLGALAAAEQVQPPTMTRLVQGLAADGLLTREEDPADRRVTLVRATPAGRQVLDEGRRRRVERLAAHLSELGGADVALLDGAGRVLLDVFGRSLLRDSDS